MVFASIMTNCSDNCGLPFGFEVGIFWIAFSDKVDERPEGFVNLFAERHIQTNPTKIDIFPIDLSKQSRRTAEGLRRPFLLSVTSVQIQSNLTRHIHTLSGHILIHAIIMNKGLSHMITIIYGKT